MCCVYFDRLHGVHIYACVFASGTESFYARVCLCAICACPPVHQVCPLSQQIQPDSRLGQGKRCASERQYHCSVCKTKLTIGRERERGRMSKAQGFKGRGVEISAKEIHEVVISAKQTSSQGRGSGHNMGGCSISSEMCSVNHCMCPERSLGCSFTCVHPCRDTACDEEQPLN